MQYTRITLVLLSLLTGCGTKEASPENEETTEAKPAGEAAAADAVDGPACAHGTSALTCGLRARSASASTASTSTTPIASRCTFSTGESRPVSA